LALIIAAAAIYGVLFFKSHETNPVEGQQTSESTDQNSTKDSTQNSDQKSDRKPEEIADEVKPESEKNNSQYEGENPNNFSTITGAINIGPDETNKLTVRVIMDQVLSSSGTCKITLVHSSGSIRNVDAAVEPGPSSSLCVASVDIEPGNWKITVDVSADGKTGTISGEANI
jgi:hypothetical protein